jgi:hypothetical protein
MLRSIKSLHDYTLAAADGEIGRCKDFLFDDRDWVVRYMVADTGGWLPGRKVLISPLALLRPDWMTRQFPVALTRQEIEDSPALDAHAPVSREYEIVYHRFFSLPFYWVGAELWGTHPDPAGVVHPVPDQPETPPPDAVVKEGHLRSCNEVMRYELQAREGDREPIDDLIADDSSWALRFVVVDTRRWIPGGQVLVPTHRVESVDWTNTLVHSNLMVDEIKNSPPYSPGMPVNVEYEKRLYDYYGRPRS